MKQGSSHAEDADPGGAWLVREDPVVKQELSTTWHAVLSAYEPQPFRNLR